jgi:hypothetical protein
MRFAMIVVLVVLAILLVNRGEHRLADAEPSKYVDNVYHFSISPPDFPEAKGVCIVAAFTGATEGGFAPNVNVLTQPNSMSPDDYMDVTKTQVEQRQGKIDSSKSIQVSNHDARLIEYEMASGGRSLHFLSLAVFLDGKVDLVTCTAPAAKFEANRERFQKCVDSFKLSE